MTSGARVSLVVNGRRREVADVPFGERLLDTLRWRLSLKGTKEGCRAGNCGACTVLVDGRPMLSCLLLTHEANGASVTTIEGVEALSVGRAVVRAFEAEGGLQCGYCTPGFVMALVGHLASPGADRSPAAVRAALEGNLCRCTGYASIVRAAQRAAKEVA